MTPEQLVKIAESSRTQELIYRLRPLCSNKAEEEKEVIEELLVDLMHFCRLKKYQFSDRLLIAHATYVREARNIPDSEQE